MLSRPFHKIVVLLIVIQYMLAAPACRAEDGIVEEGKSAVLGKAVSSNSLQISSFSNLFLHGDKLILKVGKQHDAEGEVRIIDLNTLQVDWSIKGPWKVRPSSQNNLFKCSDSFVILYYFPDEETTVLRVFDFNGEEVVLEEPAKCVLYSSPGGHYPHSKWDILTDNQPQLFSRNGQSLPIQFATKPRQSWKAVPYNDSLL